MVKVGTQNISGLRAGADKIGRAYLGDVLVFGAGETPGPAPGPSRLPEGYQEAAYIQTNGYCYIDTGIAPTLTVSTVINMDVEPLGAVGSGYFFYSVKSGTTTYSCCCYFTETAIKANMGYGSTAKTIISNPAKEKIRILYNAGPETSTEIDGAEITLPKVSAMIGGTTVSFTNYGWSGAGMPTIKLLASGSANYLSGKLYACQITYKGALARDFVPCIDPSGAVGLYDLVDGKFYANSGTGTLTAGPAV